MNIVTQATNKEELEELETVVKVFVVIERIKELTNTV